jgi:hypothetical protein
VSDRQTGPAACAGADWPGLLDAAVGEVRAGGYKVPGVVVEVLSEAGVNATALRRDLLADSPSVMRDIVALRAAELACATVAEIALAVPAPNGEALDAVLNGARSIARIGRLISAPGCALWARLPALSLQTWRELALRFASRTCCTEQVAHALDGHFSRVVELRGGHGLCDRIDLVGVEAGRDQVRGSADGVR